MWEEASPIGQLQRQRDELAKAWLVQLIERGQLTDAEGIDVAWVAREAPRLVGAILRHLEAAPLGPDEPAEQLDFGLNLRGLRRPGSDAQTARDLAVLHGLLLGALAELLDDGKSELARVGVALAAAIGEAQAALTEELAAASEIEAGRDRLTGLAGAAELADWLRVMFATQQRYGTPFSILLVDVDGLARINQAYGRASGDRMLAALATLAAKRIRSVDRAFRRGDDELCVVLPHQGPIPAQAVAERLAGLVRSAQSDDGPRLDVAIGIASCPEHGHDSDALLAKAEEATYEAKASGQATAIAGGATPAWLQDR